MVLGQETLSDLDHLGIRLRVVSRTSQRVDLVVTSRLASPRLVKGLFL